MSQCLHSELSGYILHFLGVSTQVFTGISSLTRIKRISWFPAYSLTIMSSFIFLLCEWHSVELVGCIGNLGVDHLSYLLLSLRMVASSPSPGPPAAPSTHLESCHFSSSPLLPARSRLPTYCCRCHPVCPPWPTRVHSLNSP